MSYVLDANVFISASRLHYGLDFCPAFWSWLIHQGNVGKVLSIDKIADEVKAGADDLSEWAKKSGKSLFQRFPPSLDEQFGEVSNWAMSRQYTPAAINNFFQVADYHLVVFALAKGYTVVTHEVMSDSRSRIKIPNACSDLGVECITPWQMLRREKARFVLGDLDG